MQGANQYRRLPLDAFFEAQRVRVLHSLAAHLTRARDRVREYEAGEYEPEMLVEVRGSVSRGQSGSGTEMLGAVAQLGLQSVLDRFIR
jgi:hypothetical protein